MDGVILHKAYYEYLMEPEYREPDSFSNSRTEQNIKYFKRELNDEKQKFMGYYSYFKNNIAPKLQRCKKMVYVPELKGHIWMTDEENFEKYMAEQIRILTEAERMYGHIKDIEKMLLNEEIKLLNERKQAEERRFLSKYRDKQMETERWHGHKNPKQLELF